jgi:hypothetical protein
MGACSRPVCLTSKRGDIKTSSLCLMSLPKSEPSEGVYARAHPSVSRSPMTTPLRLVHYYSLRPTFFVVFSTLRAVLIFLVRFILSYFTNLPGGT